MKRTLFFLGVLAALVASPAMAQMVYVHGGAGFPSSSAFNDAYQTGFNVGIGVGVPITSQLEGVVRGSYDRFGLDVPDGANLDGGTFSSLSATANLKLNGPLMSNRVMPYGIGGIGLFRIATGDLKSGSTTIEGDSKLDFGLQFAAGLSFEVSPRTSLMIEPNYVLVFSENENTQFFPIRLGVSFGL